MKILLRASKRKKGIKISSGGQGFRKLFTVWEIKRFGCPAFTKIVSIVLTSLSNSMTTALWQTRKLIKSLFNLEDKTLIDQARPIKETQCSRVQPSVRPRGMGRCQLLNIQTRVMILNLPATCARTHHILLAGAYSARPSLCTSQES